MGHNNANDLNVFFNFTLEENCKKEITQDLV